MAIDKLELVITDLDGTLLNPQHEISELDYRSLQVLGDNKIYRVIATGRSLYSVNKVLPPDFPIDYLIFSSGAGIIDWSSKEILLAQSLESGEVAISAHFLTATKISFMIHKPIPDSHYFVYHQAGDEHPDFQHRITLYEKFAHPLTFNPEDFGAACQLRFMKSLPTH